MNIILFDAARVRKARSIDDADLSRFRMRGITGRIHTHPHAILTGKLIDFGVPGPTLALRGVTLV